MISILLPYKESFVSIKIIFFSFSFQNTQNIVKRSEKMSGCARALVCVCVCACVCVCVYVYYNLGKSKFMYFKNCSADVALSLISFSLKFVYALKFCDSSNFF